MTAPSGGGGRSGGAHRLRGRWRAAWEEGRGAGRQNEPWEVINTPETASLLQRYGYDGIVAKRAIPGALCGI